MTINTPDKSAAQDAARRVVDQADATGISVGEEKILNLIHREGHHTPDKNRDRSRASEE